MKNLLLIIILLPLFAYSQQYMSKISNRYKWVPIDSIAAADTSKLKTTGDKAYNNYQFTGKIAVAGDFVPTNAISITGQSAQTVWQERNTTSNTAGNNLTIQSGGATSGATDKAGGDLLLKSGQSTGQGNSTFEIQTPFKALTSGTSDNSYVTRMKTFSRYKSLNDNVNDTLFSVTLSTTETFVAYQIFYGLIGKESGANQGYSHTGMVTFTAINLNGTVGSGITEVADATGRVTDNTADTWTTATNGTTVYIILKSDYQGGTQEYQRIYYMVFSTTPTFNLTPFNH